MKDFSIIPDSGNTETGAECKAPITFNLSVADVRGQRTNTSYPHRVTISSAEDLAKAAAFDHTSGRFSDCERANGEIITAYRSLATYLDSDCDIFDVDNDPGSSSLPDIPPDQWKYPADIDAMFPGVTSYTIYSAHHMVEKDGRPARPKFHKYYPRRRPLTDAKQAKAFHKEVQAYCPAFDANALDAARFIFGVENPVVEYVPSEMTLDEFMEQRRTTKAVQERPAYREPIYEGRRNSELSKQALKIIKRFGPDDGRAIKAFFQAAGRCEPPLAENELESIWNSALKGYEEKVLTDPGYMPPAEYESKEYAGSLEPADYTDVGQAAVFVETFGDVVKYTPATKWLVYDGAVWKESELKARAKAQELTDMQLEEAQKRINAARQTHDSTLIRGSKAEMEKQKLDSEEYFRKFVLSERKSNKIAATLTVAAPKLEIDVSQLDKDPYLLNTPGGTVDLRTGQMRKHDLADYCTKMTAVSPSQDGEELWYDFLDSLTCNDEDLKNYLQEVAGVCVIGEVRFEKIVIAIGNGGNGKSTFFNAQYYTLGDYAGSMSSEILTAQCRKNKSPELAELRGTRLVICAELEEGMRLDTATAKKLSSTDPIRGEKKYKAPFDFVPSHTVIVYTNHLPKVGTLDKGTWDRLNVIPFNARFRGTQAEIMNYGKYLHEHAGGAILQWMIEGAGRVIAHDFKIETPECVARAIAEYQDTNNWLDSFLEACCDLDKAYTQKSGELYKAYRSHCDEIGEYHRSLADFKKALEMAGYSTERTNKGSIVRGLRVKCTILNRSAD